jgi:hypothetical protein
VGAVAATRLLELPALSGRLRLGPDQLCAFSAITNTGALVVSRMVAGISAASTTRGP